MPSPFERSIVIMDGDEKTDGGSHLVLMWHPWAMHPSIGLYETLSYLKLIQDTTKWNPPTTTIQGCSVSSSQKPLIEYFFGMCCIL